MTPLGDELILSTRGVDTDPDDFSDGPGIEEAVWDGAAINQTRFFEILKKRTEEKIGYKRTDGEDGERFELLYDCDGNKLSSNQRFSSDRDLITWEDKGDFTVSINNHKRLKKLKKARTENTIHASEYELGLREQYVKLHPTPVWALRNEEIDQDGDEHCHRSLRTSSTIIRKTPLQELQAGKLSVTRVDDISAPTSDLPTLTRMCFLPNKSIIYIAGEDCRLRSYYVDGTRNVLLKSILFKKYPIRSVKVAPDSKEIVVVGNQRHYYVLDTLTHVITKCTLSGFFASRMNKSRTIGSIPIKDCCHSNDNKYIAFISSSSSIVLVFRETKQIYTQIGVNDTVRSACFCPLGRYIYILTVKGQIFKFDVDTKMCVYKFSDQGCTRSKSLDIDPSGNYIAIGSSSGVVNIYLESMCSKTTSPDPVKSVMNLTSSANIVKFSPYGQILAIASSAKKNSLRLLNMSSLTIFPNWPTHNTPLGYIKSVSFSSNSRYLAIANNKGRVVLYMLNAYT